MRWRRRRIGKRRRALRKRALLSEPSFVEGWNSAGDITSFLNAVWPIVLPAMKRATDAPYTKIGENWSGYLDGFCPVQGYGLVDGLGWYFRSRWDEWSFEVFRTPIDPIGGLPDEDPIWETGGGYGEEADASWMPYSEAWIRIEQSIASFRNAIVSTVALRAFAEEGVESYVTDAAVEGGPRP